MSEISLLQLDPSLEEEAKADPASSNPSDPPANEDSSFSYPSEAPSSLETSPQFTSSADGEGACCDSPVNIGEASLAMALSLLSGERPCEILPDSSGAPIPFGMVPKIRLFGIDATKNQRKFEDVIQQQGILPKISLRMPAQEKPSIKQKLQGTRQRAWTTLTRSPATTPSSTPSSSSAAAFNKSAFAQQLSLQPPLSSSSSPAATSPGSSGYNPASHSIIKEGWLQKLSDSVIITKFSKSWDPRYCVLSKSSMVLSYYKNKPTPGEKPYKFVDLNERSIVTADALTGKLHSFGLFHPSQNPIFFAGKTEDEMVSWIQALEVHCLGLKNLLGAKIEDFDLLCTIGKGAYGRVFQVRHKESKTIYAMKVVRKREVVERGPSALEGVRNERRVMALVDHPFVIKMRYSFQSTQHLCFVMDIASGGELFSLLREKGPMIPDHVQFYGAELVLALDYLHSCGIVYRDLKPENVLLSEDGHVKLTDFGFSRLVNTSGRLYSICGTPVYMAPEVVLEKGYSHGADWWSMGILLYELLCGAPPFYDENLNVCYEILTTKPFVFPVEVPSAASGLVRALCTPDPKFRLGCGPKGSDEIKTHPFFRDVHWMKVFEKKVTPPHIPVVKHREDVSAFDKEFLQMENGNRLSVAGEESPCRSDSVFGDFDFNAMTITGLTAEERRIAVFGRDVDAIARRQSDSCLEMDSTRPSLVERDSIVEVVENMEELEAALREASGGDEADNVILEEEQEQQIVTNDTTVDDDAMVPPEVNDVDMHDNEQTTIQQ